MSIVIKKDKVLNIPVINMYNSEASKKLPVVIMLHGAGGKKENNIERAQRFVEQGFYVLLLDAYDHGELKTIKMDEDFDINMIFKMYLETSKYINQLIDYYKQHSEFGDFDRVGLLGFSMGAHTIYNHISKERHVSVKAAVPIIGSPHWVSFVRRFINSIEQLDGVYDERKVVEIEKFISNIQPSTFIESIQDFPLLIINGELDEKISIKEINEFYKDAERIYNCKENIMLIQHSGIGHRVTDDMLNEAIQWFIKYL